jgi:Methyltransferase domain
MKRNGIKRFLDRHPQMKALAAVPFGRQLIFLEYPVELIPRWNAEAHPELLRLVGGMYDEYRNRLRSFVAYGNKLATLQGVNWINGYFGGLDAISLYCLLAETNPKRYIEIGSGNSTLFARSSIRDNDLQTKIISIDPTPRRQIEKTADVIMRRPAETIPVDFFSQLDCGDILFVDNSHRCLPNSDVTAFFLDVLPGLKPGVLVHLHDITLPWDYSELTAKRAWSEQYLLATALLMGNRIETVLANTFITRTPDLISLLNPIFEAKSEIGRSGCSYWFRCRSMR